MRLVNPVHELMDLRGVRRLLVLVDSRLLARWQQRADAVHAARRLRKPIPQCGHSFWLVALDARLEHAVALVQAPVTTSIKI